jgi:uncharacterized protein YjbI with pentapeptide repeats
LARLKGGVAQWNKWRVGNGSAIDLAGVDFRGLSLENARLDRSLLTESNLGGVNARRASFRHADFVSAELGAAGLRRADCSHSCFFGAQMVNADLRDTKLLNCDFSYANAKGCNFSGSVLERVIFRDTNLNGARFTGATFVDTIFAGIDFRAVKGLEKAEHFGPSTIGLDSLVRSGGQIPDTFLRGAGVDDSLIGYATSLARRPVQFYSCFISYSTADLVLAKRLNEDLQSSGVRCWFAPEDLKIGDRFRQRIDDSIRRHDKLLVLLSSHSLNSPWVESEVEAAFEVERRHGRTILVPVRTDDAVMTSPAAWAAELRRSRHIGEFDNWEKPARYAQAFKRLLRDLKL